jgi:hypothetical protein
MINIIKTQKRALNLSFEALNKLFGYKGRTEYQRQINSKIKRLNELLKPLNLEIVLKNIEK